MIVRRQQYEDQSHNLCLARQLSAASRAKWGLDYAGNRDQNERAFPQDATSGSCPARCSTSSNRACASSPMERGKERMVFEPLATAWGTGRWSSRRTWCAEPEPTSRTSIRNLKELRRSLDSGVSPAPPIRSAWLLPSRRSVSGRRRPPRGTHPALPTATLGALGKTVRGNLQGAARRHRSDRSRRQ